MAPTKRKVGGAASSATGGQPQKAPGVSPTARNAAARYDRGNDHSPDGIRANRTKKRGSGNVTGPGSKPSPFGPRKS